MKYANLNLITIVLFRSINNFQNEGRFLSHFKRDILIFLIFGTKTTCSKYACRTNSQTIMYVGYVLGVILGSYVTAKIEVSLAVGHT